MFRKFILALCATAALGAVASSTSAWAYGRGWCYWHPYICDVD